VGDAIKSCARQFGVGLHLETPANGVRASGQPANGQPASGQPASGSRASAPRANGVGTR
jgi:hypothetical protein